MRKYLSHAFSQRSLSDQELLISNSVDAFIRKLGNDGPQGTDIVMAFTLMSFDIIGDLGFGETFRGIESSMISINYQPKDSNFVLPTEEIHPWIHRMTGAMMQGAIADCFTRFPMVAKLVMTLFGSHIKRIIADTKINEGYSIDLVERFG